MSVTGQLRTATLLLVAALVASSCSQQQPDAPSPQDPKTTLHGEVASYDIAAGETTRLIVGLFTGDELFVSHGTIEMAFSYLGERDAPRSPEPYSTATGTFLSVPGTEVPPELPDRPIAAPASRGRGVYAADVNFDRPGFWEVAVRAEVERRGTLTATGAFEVLAEHQLPAPGDRALMTDNLTNRSTDAPREAVDSRWRDDEQLPDPVLHTATIADALRAGRPAVVVFSTPVYCVSRFCGPVTDMVEELARDYADRAEFIHIEIWRN